MKMHFYANFLQILCVIYVFLTFTNVHVRKNLDYILPKYDLFCTEEPR